MAREEEILWRQSLNKNKVKGQEVRQELRIILGGLATQYGGCSVTELGVVEEMRFSY